MLACLKECWKDKEMTIKSDKWIRRMAKEHGMIEPFEPGQVRQNAAGEKIVSYGKKALSTFIPMSASFPPTALLWPAHWNISVFPAMCSPFAWVKALMPGAGLL
jgi:hypothetical protein